MQFAHMLLESMPVKPLPAEVVNKIRKKLRNPLFFESLPIIDVRSSEKYGKGVGWSRRVREATIKTKAFPKGIRFSVKRIHGAGAKQQIQFLTKMVKIHNSEKRPALYELWKPVAYRAGEVFIVMARTPAPTIYDILYPMSALAKKRSELFFRAMRKAHGITIRKLERAYNELYKNLDDLAYLQDTSYAINEAHVFVLGYKKGKFIFMPVMDTY